MSSSFRPWKNVRHGKYCWWKPVLGSVRFEGKLTQPNRDIEIFAVPATSAAIEREFSLAGNIVTKKRSRLSPGTINDIIFLNSFERYNKQNAQNK
jgi:hypothetical protein